MELFSFCVYIFKESAWHFVNHKSTNMNKILVYMYLYCFSHCMHKKTCVDVHVLIDQFHFIFMRNKRFGGWLTCIIIILIPFLLNIYRYVYAYNRYLFLKPSNYQGPIKITRSWGIPRVLFTNKEVKSRAHVSCLSWWIVMFIF